MKSLDLGCDDENAAWRGTRPQKRVDPALCADMTAKMEEGQRSDQAQSSMTAGTHSLTSGSLEIPDTEPLHVVNTPQINKEEKDRILRAMK